MDARGSEDVDFSLEKLFQVLAQSNEIKKRTARFEVDKKIKVAPLVVGPPRNGAKDTKITGAVFRRNPKNLFSPPEQIHIAA